MKYGDRVILMFDGHAQQQDENISKSHRQRLGIGLASALGFTDKDAYILAIPSEEKIEFDEFRTKLSTRGISNIRDCVFEIQPIVITSFHKEYRRMLKTYEQFKTEYSNADLTNFSLFAKTSQIEMIAFMEEKLEELQNRVKLEMQRNDAIIQSKKGQNIYYGDKIRFRHADSGLYLSCSYQGNEGSAIGFGAEMTRWASSLQQFTLVPKFKSKLIGHIVEQPDEVILESYRKGYYLDFSLDQPHPLNDSDPRSEENKFRKEITIFDPRYKKFKLAMTSDSKVSWRLIQTHSNSYDPAHINGLDLIRLHHSEYDACLTSSLKFRASAPEVYLRTYTGSYSSETNTISSIWEISDETSAYLNNPLTFQQESKGGTVSSLKLQHMLSQKHLYSISHKDTFLCVLANLTTKPLRANYLTLNFEPIVATSDYLLDKKTYTLKSSNELVLKADPKIVLTRKYITRTKEMETDSYFIPLEDGDVEETNKLCIISVGGDSENSFKLEKVTEKEKTEIFFAKSAVPLLEYFVRIFVKSDRKKLKPSVYLKMEKLLKRICCFVHDVNYRKDINIFSFSTSQVKSRQKVLREYCIIDYLTDILEKSFSTEGFFELKKLTQQMYITKILAMAYTTIRYIIMDNPANELYTSQWLNLFLVQSLKTRGQNEIKAESTLTELIDNNKRILKTRVRKETINKFIQLVSSDKISKYLKILRVIIVCDGQPMKNNQREVSKLILKDEKMSKKLLFGLRLENGEIQTSVTNEWETLNSLTRLDWGSGERAGIYDFFLSLTRLLADLCLDRNYLAIHMLQPLYPLKICQALLNDPKVSMQTKDAFTYLTHVLWIDVSPFHKVDLPNLIVQWEDLDSTVVSTSKLPYSTKYIFQTPQNLSEDYQYFKSNLLNSLLNVTKKEMAKEATLIISTTRLDLLLKMITLNMISYEEYKTLFSICMNIGDICHSFLETSTDFDAIQSINDRKKKVMELSILVCQVLSQLYNHEIDAKKSNILKNLKEFVQSLSEGNKRLLKKLRVGVSSNGPTGNSMIDARTMTKENQSSSPTHEFGKNNIELLQPIDRTLEGLFSDTLNEDYCCTFFKSRQAILLLIRLSIVGNGRMTQLCMDVLHQLHSQCEKLKHALNDSLFIGKQLEDNYEKIKETTTKLTEISETAEKWFMSPRPHELQELRYTLNELESELVKKKVYLEPEDEVMGESGEIGYGSMHELIVEVVESHFESPSKWVQDLYRLVRVDDQLLRWDLLFHEYIIPQQSQDSLKRIYRLLSLLVKDNRENQRHLLPQLSSIFLQHFQMPNIPGIMQFFSHFVSRNYDLTDDQHLVNNLTKILFQQVDKYDANNPVSSYLLKIISNLVFTAKKRSRSTQNLVLRKLFEAQNIIEKDGLQLTPACFIELSDEVNASFQEKIYRDNKGIIIPSKASYIIAFIKLLCTCCEGKNSFCENISQNIVSLQTAISIINSTGLHIVFKKPILDFIFEVYVDTEKESSLTFQELVINVAAPLLTDFTKILTGEFQGTSTGSYIVSTLYCIKHSTFVQNYLMKIARFYTELLEKPNRISKQSIAYQKYSQFVRGLMQTLDLHRDHKDPKIRNTIVALRFVVLEEHSDAVHEEIMKKQHTKMGLLSSQSKTAAKPHRNSISQLSKQTKILVRKDMEREEDNAYTEENRSAEDIQLVQKLMRRYFESGHFKSRKTLEFINLLDCVTTSEEKDSFKRFAESILEFLQPDDRLTKSTDDYLVALKIFRFYVEAALANGNKSTHQELWRNEFSLTTASKKLMVERQNELVNLDIVKLANQIFSDVDIPEIQNEVFSLMIALLTGDNPTVQLSFYNDFCKKTDSNELVCTKLFQKLKSILESSINFIRNNIEKVSSINTKIKEGQAGDLDDDLEDKELCVALDQKVLTVIKIYKFFTLLCDGHNPLLQNFLREQYPKNDIRASLNINIVEYTAHVLSGLVKYLRPEVVDLGHSLMNFLIETVQGPCIENQNELYETKIIDFCKDLMDEFKLSTSFQIRSFEGESKVRLQKLLTKCLKLFNSLLEGNSDKNIEESMYELLDWEHIYTKLKDGYESYMQEIKSNGGKEPSRFEGQIVEIFEGIFLIRRVFEAMGKDALSPPFNLGVPHKTAIEFYLKHTGHIQIVFSDGMLHNIQTLIHPACLALDYQTQQQILLSLNRATPKDKLIDFTYTAPKLFELIDHLTYLRSLSFLGIKGLFSNKTFQNVKVLALIVATIINLIIFIFFQKVVSRGVSVERPEIDANHVSIRILSYMHASLVFVELLLWLVVCLPVVIKDGWRDIFSMYHQQLLLQNIPHKELDLQFKSSSLSDVGYSQRLVLLKKVHSLLGDPFSTPRLEYFLRTLWILQSNTEFIYILFNLTVSISAVALELPFFYGLQLFEIVTHFTILQNIVKAVTQNAKQLGLTVALMMCIVFTFAVIGFEYFPEDYYMGDIENGENACTTLLQCFFHCLALGPRSTGSIGDVMVRISFSQKNHYFVRFFYDLSMFILINTTFMNLLFGMIIDKFAEMRDRRKSIENDMKTVCTICSLDRLVFDKIINGFENHTRSEHNFWHYLYFMYGLRLKDKLEMSGMESYVAGKINEDEIDWFPLLRAMSIHQNISPQEDRISVKLDNLRLQLQTLFKRLFPNG